jgi:Fibronectin type III domain
LTAQATTYKFGGLKPSTDYRVSIKVTNLVGESDSSDSVPATTGIEPSRPGLLTFVASTRTTLDLRWELLQGADTGGSDERPLVITYYYLYTDDGLGGQMALRATLDGATSEYLIEYLKSGLTYRFRLQAENSIGLKSAMSTEQYM